MSAARELVRRTPFCLVGLAVLGFCLLAAPGTASAQQVIQSAGPINQIFVNEDLACQVTRPEDASPEFFGGTDPGACGTFLSTEGVSFGPNVPAGASREELTPVSQTPVSGDGTVGNPFTVVTVADVGATGLRITETDSYVVGSDSYRTDIKVANTSGAPISATLYHAGDCFSQDSDSGFGYVDAAAGGVYCAGTADNSPAARLDGFAPLSAGSHFYEAGFATVWAAIDAPGSEFPDSCDCEVEEDNGAGLSWGLALAPGESATRSLLTAFSPTGTVPITNPSQEEPRREEAVPPPKRENHPPVAVPDAWTVPRGGTLVENVLENDHDPDGDPMEARVTQISFAASEWTGFGGFLQGSGEFLYTAGLGTEKALVKKITYVAVDSHGAESAPVTSTVTIDPQPEEEEFDVDALPTPTRLGRAAAKPSCARHINVVSINGGLHGAPAGNGCWKTIRLNATDAKRCVGGVEPHYYAFDEVSAASSLFAARGKLARECTRRARQRANCPPVGPCTAIGIAFYGYDARYSPRWGLAAPVPGFGVKLLELYGSGATVPADPTAKSMWLKIKKSYGGIVEDSRGTTKSIGGAVEAVCKASKVPYLGLYASTSAKPVASGKLGAVVKALNSCTKAASKKK